jgi:membrane-bound lytic murein transglycosylase D
MGAYLSKKGENLILKNFILIFAIIAFGVFAEAQISNIQPKNEVEEKFKQIVPKVGEKFKLGLLKLQRNQRREAKEEFDKALEILLESGINLRNTKDFASCYDQLIETIYRIEFPSYKAKPDIKFLVATCRWNVDNNTFNDIDDNLIQSVNSSLFSIDTASLQAQKDVSSSDCKTGFDCQKFEPSPLDELAKVELTPEEQMIDEKQYELIKVASQNRSLGFAFQVHPMIQQFINYYQGRGRQTMEVGLYRSGMFMRMARRIFREEGLPENLAWLGQVESMWKPTALSNASASGLWQFIPSTGIRFGLKQNVYVDERNSFENATRAAARYLKFLLNRYNGNWELALAAYNAGEGAVDRAIARAGVANFWYAYPYLPKETRNYVPSILATILIANNPHRYGFSHIRPAAPLEYDLVRVPPSTNLSLIAQASDTSVEYIRFLNPEFRTTKTPPEPYIVRVPRGKAEEVASVLKKARSVNQENVAVVKLMKGETIEDVARRLGVSVDQLRAVNGSENLKDRKILVPDAVKKTSYQRPLNQPSTIVNSTKPKVVKAKSGDTIRKIAERYKVSAVETGKLNGITLDAPLKEGSIIRLP